MSMFLENEQSRTYQRDKRTRFWASIKYDENSGYVIYVAECLKDWFAYRFPHFYRSAGSQWLKSSTGRSYLSIDFFDSFDLDWEKLDGVLQYVGNECFWPDKSKSTDGIASNLEACIVRDYMSRTEDLRLRTQIGGLFHDAKYENDIPLYDRNIMTAQLSNEIVKMINYTLGISDGLMQEYFSCMLISDEGIVRDKIVILVDDLYQSGVSMEKTAQFLKSCGAYKVYGVACVKAMRDSDNT